MPGCRLRFVFAAATFVANALFFAERAAAQPGEPSSVPLTAARLIHRLNDDDYFVRVRADEQLAEMGAQAREELEQAATDPNTEVRLRAKALLKRLKTEEIWRAGAVRYSAAATSAADAVAAIGLQSGNHVLLGDQYGAFDDKPIDVAFEPGEFWPAVDEICRLTNNRLRPHYDSRQPGLVLTSGNPGRYPVAYAGPVRAQITSARRAFSEDFDYESNRSDVTHTFQVNFQMTWEDRFRLIAYRAQPELVLARTDVGSTIASTQPSVSGWNIAGNGTRQLTMNLRLHPPAVAATKLEVLKLKWGLIAVGDMAELVVDDLAERRPFYQDDVELRIEQVDVAAGQRCEISVALLRDLLSADPHEAFFQECDWELLDQAGRPYRKQGQTNSRDAGGARIKLTFVGEAGDARPQKLKFIYPRIRSQRDVELTFRDVPLPNGRPQ